MVGAESAALSASRTSSERSAGEIHSQRKMERVNGIAPLSRPWHGRILLLNPTRKKDGVPSRILTGTLTLRTRPLCALSYGDKETTSLPRQALMPPLTY